MAALCGFWIGHQGHVHVTRLFIQQRAALEKIPGLGYLTATAMVATIGNANIFRNGRELAAWLGLVPRQHSTGGKQNLLGMSKRGDSYLRTLLIHGARSVLYRAMQKLDLRNWAFTVAIRRNKNVAAVALANKSARIIWALLTHNRQYQPNCSGRIDHRSAAEIRARQAGKLSSIAQAITK